MAPGEADAETVRFVTDSLRLEARSGPSTEHRIVKMLSSGTRVTVHEEADGYSRITTPDESEAWILSRYLTNDPAARDQLAQMRSELGQIRQDRERLQAALKDANRIAQGEAEGRARNHAANQRLSQELADLKRTSASAIAINQENQGLKKDLARLEGRLRTAEAQVHELQEASNRTWFMTGAGVLLGGMILGLIIPKIRWQRRRSWGEL